jgi:hypothetical protein
MAPKPGADGVTIPRNSDDSPDVLGTAASRRIDMERPACGHPDELA